MNVEFSGPATVGGGAWPSFLVDTISGVESAILQTQIDATNIELEFPDAIDSPSSWTVNADDGGVGFTNPLLIPESGSVVGA